MAKKKELKRESFKAATLKKFKDLEIFEVFTLRGDECLCEKQEDGKTIYDNRKENKRYIIDSDKVLD